MLRAGQNAPDGGEPTAADGRFGLDGRDPQGGAQPRRAHMLREATRQPIPFLGGDDRPAFVVGCGASPVGGSGQNTGKTQTSVACKENEKKRFSTVNRSETIGSKAATIALRGTLFEGELIYLL